MKCYSAVIFCLLFLCSNSSAIAQDSEQYAQRPRIGLVLSGGGALGFAHVGVLRVLEENRIPVDYIAGTSMGAIVGAAYASGASVDEMEAVLSGTDWDAVFREIVPRYELPYRYRPGRDRELFGANKFSIKKGKLQLPAGLFEGQHVTPILRELFRKVPSPVHFDKLRVPFRAVCADIETGQEVVIEKGDLASVVRASMSVPGAFSAVEIDGRYLVDGGIVNNMPVDIARKMGADIVIVVKLDVDLLKKEELDSPFSIVRQMITLLISQNEQKQLATISNSDVVLAPNLSAYGAADFNNAPQIVAEGQEYANTAIDKFSHLAISESEYKEYQRRRTLSSAGDSRIDFVRLESDTAVNEQQLLKSIRSRKGDVIDHKLLAEDASRIYNEGRFKDASYKVVTEDGRQGVIFTTHKKAWLDRYFRLGASLESEGIDESLYRLALGYRITDLDPNGGYIDINGEIGEFPHFFTEWYHPLNSGSPWFIAPSARTGKNDIILRSEGEKIAEYDRFNGSLGLDFGRSLGHLGEIRLGLFRGFGELERDLGEPTLPDFSYDTGEYRATVVLDTRDSVDFPTRGYFAQTQFRSSLEELGASDSFEDILATVSIPFTEDRDTLLVGGDYGYTFGERPPERSFSLGGFLDISGYASRALTASEYWSGKAVYYRRFSEMENLLFSLSYFLGGSLELAGFNSDIQAADDDPLIAGGSVFMGVDTPILPLYLAGGANDDGEATFYIFLGRIPSPRRE